MTRQMILDWYAQPGGIETVKLMLNQKLDSNFIEPEDYHFTIIDIFIKNKGS